MIVNGNFTNDSTVTGILIVVIGHSDVYYSKATRDGDSVQYRIITGLPGGSYNISIFVMEENGLPFERVATVPKPVIVERSKSGCTHSIIKITHCIILSTCVMQIAFYTLTCCLLSTDSIQHPLVFASPVPSWTVQPLTVWQWYINESLSSALVD